jgi:LysM repeat protein
MVDNGQSDSASPIFDGLAPQFSGESRRTRRTKILAVAASALPIIAAATASWVAGATTVTELDPTQQPPAPPEPTPQELMDATSVLGRSTHVVLAGESLKSIAEMHGIPTAALLALNGLSWQTAVHEGQELVVSKRQRKTVDESKGSLPLLAESPILESGIRADDLGRVSDGGVVTALSAEMATNARIIIQVGRDLGIPNYGIVIALATAAQESHLRNLDFGDQDSVGLFQQRPSSGWGTVSQIRDPRYAARAFFGGPSSTTPGATKGLLDVPRWQHMSLTDAAQAVQRSAFPEAYAKWEVSAWNWLFDLT